MLGAAVQLWFAARMFVLSHAMFMAMGAFGSIWLVEQGLALAPAIAVSTLVGASASLLLGAALLRLEHLQLALASLAVSELFRIALLKVDGLTGGPSGKVVPATIEPWMMIVAAGVVLACSWWLQRRWLAPLHLTRFDPRVAEAMGVRTRSYMFAFFAIGAVIAAFAGAMQAHYSLITTPSGFGLPIILTGLTLAVLGGREHWAGPVVGAFVLGVLPELFTGFERYSVIASGILLMLVLLYAPKGVIPAVADALEPLRARVGRSGARRPGRTVVDPAAVGALGRRHTGSGPALSVESVTVRYGGILAVDEATFAVAPGEVLGIIGPNGAGKTTLVNAITGQVPLAAGRVVVGGGNLTGRAPDRLVEHGLVRTFQNAQFAPEMTMGDNIASGALSTYPRVLGLDTSWPKVRAGQQDPLVAAGLEDMIGLAPGEVPLGRRRLAEVVRALLARPTVIVLDEPTAGMDEDTLTAFKAIVRETAAAGTAIVLVSHDVPVVQSLSDRVVVMSFGEVLATVDAAEVTTDDRVVNAYLGVPA
jgi:branched-chain amino acid transport system permease protein